MLIHMSIRRVAKCVGGHRLCRVLTTAKAPHGPSGLIAVTNLLKISVFLVLFGIDLKEISDDLSPMKSTHLDIFLNLIFLMIVMIVYSKRYLIILS